MSECFEMFISCVSAAFAVVPTGLHVLFLGCGFCFALGRHAVKGAVMTNISKTASTDLFVILRFLSRGSWGLGVTRASLYCVGLRA